VAAITKSTNHGDMSFSEIKPNHSHEQTTAEQTEPFFLYSRLLGIQEELNEGCNNSWLIEIKVFKGFFKGF